jgi:hypothetical protein
MATFFALGIFWGGICVGIAYGYRLGRRNERRRWMCGPSYSLSLSERAATGQLRLVANGKDRRP